MRTLREAATSMAALQNKKEPHEWWSIAEAMLAVLDSDDEQAIELANETYNRRYKQ